MTENTERQAIRHTRDRKADSLTDWQTDWLVSWKRDYRQIDKQAYWVISRLKKHFHTCVPFIFITNVHPPPPHAPRLVMWQYTATSADSTFSKWALFDEDLIKKQTNKQQINPNRKNTEINLNRVLINLLKIQQFLVTVHSAQLLNQLANNVLDAPVIVTYNFLLCISLQDVSSSERKKLSGSKCYHNSVKQHAVSQILNLYKLCDV